jgi:hypothetical protein
MWDIHRILDILKICENHKSSFGTAISAFRGWIQGLAYQLPMLFKPFHVHRRSIAIIDGCRLVATLTVAITEELGLFF